MAEAQSIILAAKTEHALFITFRRRIGRRASNAIRHALADIPARTRQLANTDPDSLFCSAIGFGLRIWPELWGEHRPRELRPFPSISGAIHPAPATEADLILHLRAHRYDYLHEFANRVVTEFAEWLEVVESVHCFDFHGGRDLTGFAEGAGNPVEEEKPAVALVGDEDPEWAGGSYLHVQRYVHNLEQWERLPIKQQETVIGRCKVNDVEIEEDDRAKTAHLSRVAVHDHGQELHILRQSMPYGSPGGEQGSMFCCYCRTPSHFERMLTRMVAPTSDGRVDLLLNFTRAVTGGAFFVPSETRIRALGHPQTT